MDIWYTQRDILIVLWVISRTLATKLMCYMNAFGIFAKFAAYVQVSETVSKMFVLCKVDYIKSNTNLFKG